MLQKITATMRRNQDRARARRDYRILLSLEDHILHDIGVPRQEVLARLAGL